MTTPTVGCHSGVRFTRDDIPSWISVDDQGTIWSTKTAGGGRRAGVCAPRRVGTVNGRGYITVGISGKTVAAHRIVYAWHYGEVPAGKLVRHLNGDRTDNRPENLALGDNVANMADARKAGAFSGSYRRGENHPKTKLTVEDVRAIRAARKRGEKLKEIGDRYEVTKNVVHAIVTRKSWKSVD